MTVSYQYDVASSTSGGFIRLLFRWRGSIWKLVYVEMFFFTAAYFSLTMMYRFFLSDFQKKIFERIVFLCSTFMDLIPLSFVLGFYVSFIATRWWNQYTAIPWPDKNRRNRSSSKANSDEVLELGLNSSPKIHQYGRQEKISDERTRSGSRFYDKTGIRNVELSSIY
ncbi:bestrophin-1 [Trichonephila clavata]|uniref:Bestrophin homolog n=1 Tax=Trichonephila clavata TaxID=2740835 RepID=A0A8X6HHR5_TRICU|nr:bestrophin-1 [Trichonephila clavata]